MPRLYLNIVKTEKILRFWDKKFSTCTSFQRKRLKLLPSLWIKILVPTARHFPSICTGSCDRKSATRKCVVRSKNDKRRESRCRCKICYVGIYPRFEMFRTKSYHCAILQSIVTMNHVKVRFLPTN